MIPIGTDLTQYAFGPAQSFFAAQPGVPSYVSPLAPPPLSVSPLANPAERQAVDALTANISGDPLVPPGESGTPGGSPAPNAGGFNSRSGLGTLGGMVGSAIGGPLGGAFGRAAGAGIGAAADASRANDIAAALGLGPVANPASAFGRAAGRTGVQTAATMGLGALGLGGIPGLGSLAGRTAARGFDGLFGGPSYGTDIGMAIADHVANRADLTTSLDREDMALGMNMRANAMSAAPRSDVAYGSGVDASGKPSGGPESGFGSSEQGGSKGDGGDSGGKGDPGDGGAKAAGGLVKPTDGRVIPLANGGKIAMGPGGGLDDLIPTTIDGSRAAALSDGEFVIPADVVSMMGDGSSNAGSRRLYELVRSIREAKTGTSEQAGPLPVGDILKRIAAR